MAKSASVSKPRKATKKATKPRVAAKRTTHLKAKSNGAAKKAATQTTLVSEHNDDIVFMLTHEQIAQRAYEIWLRKGCPNGAEYQNWLDAETELTSGVTVAS